MRNNPVKLGFITATKKRWITHV